ncbi:MAG: SDR family oxidoreductase [Aquabacterium sp.]|uniref:SDR family oxidoreductase n=1 Tax=Aquabacterium sp. TaxID=1872578 RepID=UPI0025C4989C|nr:SDR family oxidoreductase [Aquabacterium sp.]MBI3383962.1 SDR family oxidoreductase [Aquabacterium sp.]
MRAGSSILITGASSGIGLALALHLARQGHQVFAGVRQDRDAEVLRARSKGRITPLRLDVTEASSIEQALLAVTTKTHGKLDVLVNNAGVAFSCPLEMTSQAELSQLMNVNVLGTFAVTRACLPLLRETQGRIVNISSISGVFAAPGLTAYVASKHAVEGMTAALRLEMTPHGVKVCSIAPGKIDTPIWNKALDTSGALSEQHTGELQSIYRPLLDFYKRYASQDVATPMDAVLAAADQALAARHPRARYIVGRQAKLRACLNWLPTRWRELLVLRAILSNVPRP